MNDSLISFLKEIVSRVMPFNGLISYIHIKPFGDKLMMAASGDDGSMHMKSISKSDINFEEANACLSNLPYLHQTLNASFMTENSDVELKTMDRNGKTIVTQMLFQPNDRMEVSYITTDPFRSSILKPGKIAIDEWPVSFMLDAASASELSEFRKINAAAPVSGKEDIIHLIFGDGGIIAEYGDVKSHTATVALNVEVMSDTTKPVSVKMLSEHLLKAIQQSQGPDRTVSVRLHEKALQIQSETPIATHEIVLVGRKTRTE